MAPASRSLIRCWTCASWGFGVRDLVSRIEACLVELLASYGADRRGQA